MKKTISRSMIVVLLCIPIGLIALILSAGIYQGYYTRPIKTAFVERVDDHFQISIKRMHPVGGHSQLNPVRWFFPHIIETSETIRVQKIEGTAKGDQIEWRSDDHLTWSNTYGGSIEFLKDSRMKISFECKPELDCEYWNGEYDLVDRE